MRFRLFAHLVAATVLVTAATVARSNAVAPSNNETSVLDFSFTSIDGKPLIAVPETTTPLEAQTVAPQHPPTTFSLRAWQPPTRSNTSWRLSIARPRKRPIRTIPRSGSTSGSRRLRIRDTNSALLVFSKPPSKKKTQRSM
jgi:hypothetical protein